MKNMVKIMKIMKFMEITEIMKNMKNSKNMKNMKILKILKNMKNMKIIKNMKRGMSESVSRHFHEGMAGIILLTAMPSSQQINSSSFPWAQAQVLSIFMRDTVASDWPSSPWKNGWN